MESEEMREINHLKESISMIITALEMLVESLKDADVTLDRRFKLIENHIDNEANDGK